MKAFTLALASLLILTGLSATAHAGWTATRYGNTTYWNGGSEGTVACTEYGNTTYCN